jgi:hypothetical protein
MSETKRLKWLRVALVAFCGIFLVGLYLLGLVWPSGWSWHSGYSDYYLMIVGVYATLGIFLIAPRAVRSRTEASSSSPSGPYRPRPHHTLQSFAPAATATSWATYPRSSGGRGARRAHAATRGAVAPPGGSWWLPGQAVRPCATARERATAPGAAPAGLPARDHVFPRSPADSLAVPRAPTVTARSGSSTGATRSGRLEGRPRGGGLHPGRGRSENARI